ncbi:DNA methyltransferase 1-associated protein 1-like [Liolophura sinensis]|uniref:DNA methyltransferase 1-associated protein 1-like n=1 Tax=Liolophura sinensis TaxID=3198878 RepID=UPI003157FE06
MLSNLANNRKFQVEEEEYLIQELKKIELRKKEREKKTQDLQKLITAADSNSESRKGDRKAIKKKLPITQKFREPSKTTPDTTGIKFPDPKQSGVSLRSHRMKLPASVGQKKTKAIEQVLEELGIEYNPMPTEEIVTNFNELRQDIVLLYELKLALANCEYELQTLKHRHDTLAPGKMPDITIKTEPEETINVTPMTPDPATGDSPSKVKKLSEAIDVVGSPGTPNRKRKAAIEQSNIMKKIKQKV